MKLTLEELKTMIHNKRNEALVGFYNTIARQRNYKDGNIIISVKELEEILINAQNVKVTLSLN